MRIFVARPFNAFGQQVLDDIVAPACRSAGLLPAHAPHAARSPVSSSVLATMERCAGVIAVVAGQNRNVYIEAGLALAIRKPLILLARSQEDCGMLHECCPVVYLHEASTLRAALDVLLETLAPVP